MEYKSDFIKLGETQQQNKFLREGFVKWYINSKKIGIENLFPSQDILKGNEQDIIFANENKKTNFDVPKLVLAASILYNKYYNFCKKILDVPRENVDIIINTTRMDIYDSNNLLDKKINWADIDDDFPSKLMNEWSFNKKLLNKEQQARIKSLYNSTLLLGTISSNQNTTNQNTPNKINPQDSNFSEDSKILYKLYELIDIADTTHLSLPPVFRGIELFGSCVNTFNDEFCAMFDIEKKFGSLGSFWDYTFHRNGIYLCNPPFNDDFIKKMSTKLIYDLNNTKHDIVLIIVLPIWDSVTQKKINAKDFNMGFEGYDTLVNNKFLKEKMILDKHQYKYWNHSTKKLVASANSHLIILSNMENFSYKIVFNIEEFTKKWKKFCFEINQDLKSH
jgi:hypothetical protein